MQSIKRITALLLMLCLIGTALCACSDAQKEQEQKPIGTCVGYDVLYEELRYVTLSYRQKFEDTYGEGIWDNPETAALYREEFEATVWRVMRNNYAVLALCQDYMVESQFEDESISEAVDERIEEAIEAYGGEDKFEEVLRKMNTTENFMRFSLYVSALENELYYIVTDDLGMIYNDENEFADWMEDGNCVYIQHVYIRNDPTDDIAANRTKAEEVRRQLIAGEKTVEEIIGSGGVNEDPQNTKPYYVVRDVYTENFENAAFSLKNVGDASEVVETADGFYVLVRMQDSEQIFISQIPSLLKSYQWAKLEEMVNEKKEGIAIQLNEYGQSIDLLAIQ